jgi:hypothetical protein
MYRTMLPAGLAPYPTGDSAAGAARQMLLEGLAPYFSFAEGSGGRHQICRMISNKLAPICPGFDARTVRLWFIEHRCLLNGDLSTDYDAQTCGQSPLLSDTLSPPTAEGRLPRGVRNPLAGAEEADGGVWTGSRFFSGWEAGAGFRPAATDPPRAMAGAAVRAGPAGPGAAPSAAAGAATLGTADSEYARATTHIAFRALISFTDFALSFINSVLGSVIPGFEPLSELDFEDPPVQFGKRAMGRLHLLAEGDDGRSVMIDLQTPGTDCMQRGDLLSAASAFRDRRFPARASGGKEEDEEYEEEDERDPDDSSCSAERDVYAIQIMTSDSRDAPGEAGRDHNCRDGAPAVCVDTIDGIHLIQIELARVRIRFPVAAGVALRWSELEWWYYFLKFADEFTDKELERCRTLGIPEPVLMAFIPLNRRFWSAEERDEYQRELAGVGPSVEPVARRRRKREKPVGLHSQLRRLIEVFLKTGSLAREDVSDIEERFSVKLVRDIWSISRDPRKTEERYFYFVRTLERNELITQ